jgi:hypothetical protein
MVHKEEIIDTEEIDGTFVPKEVITIETKGNKLTATKTPIINKKRNKFHVPEELLDFVEGFNTSLTLISKLFKGR